ncbi:MAG: DDE-type integrase/transposase/recombinase [Sedimenticola sp.]
MKFEDYLASIYYDPEHAAAYAGLDKLYRAVRKEGRFVLSRDKIQKWLLKQEDYAVHREDRSKFERRRVVAPFVDYQWDADTANMEYYKKENDGYAYFLLTIDIMSKYVWTVALRSRKAKEMVDAFEQIFERGRQPTRVRSDKGTEFVNKDVKQLLKKEGVEYFATQNIVKASYAERAIKTIKSRIVRYMTRKQTHRWIDVLPKITESYNKTYHRSIKRAPKSVKPKDSVDLWKLQYYPKTVRPVKPRIGKYKYRVGDIVRISFLRRQFQREYDERWSRELYVVNERFMSDAIPQYELKDYAGEVVIGTFYQNQIKKAYEQDTYLIEKVIRSRKKGKQKEHLVRWKGWAPKFDSWIGEEDLRNLNSVANAAASS